MVKSEPLPKLAVDDKAANDDASAIDLKAMVVDNLTVTKLYRALAKRHDELVDAVTAKLRKQAE